MTVDVLAPVLRLISRVEVEDVAIGAGIARDWPTDFVTVLIKNRIFTAGPAAHCTICPGCVRNCVMEVVRSDSVGLTEPSTLVVCDKPEDYGIIDIDGTSLQQWRCSRRGLIGFLASQLGLRAKSAASMLSLVRFGTSNRLMRPIALEFADTAKLVIGDARHDLSDLLIWSGGRLQLDWNLLRGLADQSEAVTGDNQYQRSTVNRDNRKRRTKLRDGDLQVAMDRVRSAHPKWTKERCAREVTTEFKGVSWMRIMRVTRVRK